MVLPVPELPATRQVSPTGIPPPHHLVQAGDAEASSVWWRHFLLPRWHGQGPREERDAAGGNAEGVPARDRVLAPALHHLQLSHGRVPPDILAHPEDAVGHGELGGRHYLCLGVLTHQEGGDLPAGQQGAEIVDEGADVVALVAAGKLLQCLEGVDDQEGRHDPGHLLLYRLQSPPEPLLAGYPANVEEDQGGVDLGRIEEVELLLVAQHLQHRLSEGGHV